MNPAFAPGRRRMVWFVGLLGILAAVEGCTRATPKPAAVTGTSTSDAPAWNNGNSAPAGSRGTIAYTTMTLKNPFFKTISDSMTAAGEKQGYRVIVNDPDLDVKIQAQHIDDYIARKVTAIVVSPADRLAIGEAIKRANAAQIPVFTCDLECAAEGVKIAGHVSTDNFQGGQLAGQVLVEALKEAAGQVLILHHKQANSCILRVNGFLKFIADHNAQSANKIEIVSELEGGGLQDEAYRVTSDALQAHPNLNAIFAINDPSALGAWTALKQVNKVDQVIIIGFDGQLEGKRAILEGKIYADPIQFPSQMAERTVDQITKYLAGDDFEAVELIPAQLYRKADAEQDPELKSAAAAN